jgi:predicted double-glycine peptidase
MRDAGVVRQAFDYSCGSAVLATLLSGVDGPVSEAEILEEVLSGLTDEEKDHTMAAGLSLLDLQQAAERRGYRAAGYRVAPDFLRQLTRPVVVFIQPHGYRHFAVLRGIRGDRVFLADPARGNIRVPMWRFLEWWRGEEGKGVLFVVDSETPATLELAQQGPIQPEILGARQLMNIGTSHGLHGRLH